MHRLPDQLRGDMVKLTNATQNFVMLLHVSSFAPSTPRLNSPMVGGNQSSNSGAVNTSAVSQSPTAGGLSASAADERPQASSLGAGLARSRSAQPPASSKLVPPGSSSSTPRSALPQQQNFKIPSAQRTNGASKLRNGDTAPSADSGLSVEGSSQVNGV